MSDPQYSKSPAFQFYPRDFLSSAKVDVMSMTERGAYITLLARCWLDDGLPTDISILARWCRMTVKQFSRMWTNSTIGTCFHERDGKFFNERLDTEKQRQAEYRRRQTDRAVKRWEKPESRNAVALQDTHSTGNALLSASASASATASKNTREEKDVSCEPLHGSQPTGVEFPVVGGGAVKVWPLMSHQVAEWLEAYPSLPVLAECRKALVWVQADPSRRKTAKGMLRFLVGWLSRAQNSGAGRGPGPLHSISTPKTAGNVAALQSFVARHEAIVAKGAS